MRSRTEIAMVFPVTSSKVKNTTPPIVNINNSIFPSCFANPAANADSVSVLVSVEELAKPLSIAAATLTESSGESRFTTYQPTRQALGHRGYGLVKILPLQPELGRVSVRAVVIINAIQHEFPGFGRSI